MSWLVGWLEVGNRGELVSSIVGWFGADRCAWREIDEAAPEFVYSAIIVRRFYRLPLAALRVVVETTG